MAYTLIKGRYRVTGYSPDGDSVRFAPDDPELVNHLPGMAKRIALGDSIQLRLECIDSLETHYLAGSNRLARQPKVPAEAARGALLTALGFADVEWDDHGAVASCAEDDQVGYILANKGDAHGTRPVAYAFTGEADAEDGKRIFLKADLLTKSVNYDQVEKGFAYPMYYQGAFHDLRAAFDAATKSAQKKTTAGSVWATDVTTTGVAVPPYESLVDASAIWPKLFRRISNYFKEHPKAESLDGFIAFLEAVPDPCIDLDTGSWTTLHNVVSVEDGKVRLTKPITRLIFKD